MNESSIIIMRVYVRNSVTCVVVVRQENKAFLRRRILDTVAEVSYIRHSFLYCRNTMHILYQYIDFWCC